MTDRTATAETVLERLAALVAATTWADLPATQASSVPQRVLDVLGICVRASTVESSRAVLGHVADQGGTPRSTVVGLPQRLPAPLAAFANGVMAHSLDYDDTHLPSILHPSASVVPAALAVAQAEDRSGEDLVAAVAAGLEVTIRLGMAGYDRQRRANVWFDRGQHATSICGTIGSAAAAAHLGGLGESGIAHAMAVAASMASGIIEANRAGGTVKRMHCGWAAQAGVTAAQLAARGITGPPTVFEGRFGLFEAFLGEAARPEEVLAGLREDPALNDWGVADITYKPYPANHYTHTGIDAALSLRADGLRAEDVDSAHLGVAGATVRTIGEPIDTKRRPTTGYQAQFSGPYTIAAALLGGGGLGVGLADFDDALVGEPRRLALMDRVTVGADPRCDEVYPHAFPAVLTVRTVDGGELVAEVMSNRGSAARPLSDEELARKFADNTEGLLDGPSRDHVVESCAKLPQLASLDDLLDPLARSL